ncbi:SNF2-related protein [Lasiodiplodia theobromae]|uniref:DNA helicase n=1 Tax=Lasiodiplodia theobromae TaxID=45133 RepID=A0A5N5DSR6_9PEZI|nr:Snf2 family helicase [Lasiodiplodia theobromae]KAB2580720.1 Helicase swr1 [Lasiodiplodia theobromae]KAF4539682.1 Snf2 family helicase [Lasiodiplodia theobromae]KAF9635781.1 SNF2-related protein [Lasiodiplodia theobromae]
MQNTDVLERDESTHHRSNGLAAQPPSDGNAHDATCTNGQPFADDAPTDRSATPGGGPPSKRRKLDDSSRPSRPPSPPWKRIEADGPTSFMVDGKRRSGRMNALPVEQSPQPDARRSSRRALQKSTSTSNLTKTAGSQTARKAAASPAPKSLKPQHQAKSSAAQSPAHKTPARRSRAAESTPARTPQAANPTHGSSRRARAEANSTPNGVPRRKSGRISEAQSAAEANASQNGYSRSHSDASPRAQRPKIDLTGPIELPYLHPLHAQPGDENSSFARWLEQDDPLAGEDLKKLTPEEAKEEALLRLRILDAAEPGGVLSEERCSKYAIEAEEEPPPRYGPWDHIAAHACHFRKLLMKEHREHVQTARRLAHECAEAWRAREDAKQARLKAERPKTKEELEEEEKEDAGKRYRQLVRDMQQTWVLVKAEVDKRRQDRWLEEQEKLGKQTMKSLLHQSTALLKERRNMAGSMQSSDDEDDFESFMDEDDEEDGETESRMASTRPASSMAGKEDVTERGETEMDSENMSSDESEEDPLPDDDDANLTQEQLREKYAKLQLPDLPSSDEDEDEDDEDEEDDDDGPGLASLLTNGHVDKSDESPALDSVMNESKANGIDPANIQLEEVDEILMDDEDDDSDMNMDSDSDEGSATEPDDEDGEESEEDEDEGLGTWGFLSAQEISDLKKKAAEQVDDTAEPAPSDEEGTPPPEEDPELMEDATSGPLENGHIEEPNGTTLDQEHATITPTNGVSENKSPRKEMDVSDSMEDVQQSGEDKEENAEEVDEIVESASTLRTPVPALFRGKLRPYQHEGLDWLAGLYDGDTNGILADEMGLGKTIQTIALLAHLAVEKEVWGPHLVVVPTSVMLNWEMEFKKFCPGFKVLAYYGSIEERRRKRQGWMNDDMWNVVITSYQLILHDAAAFKKRSWHYLILDEAHNIKNFQTQRWQTLLTFKTSKRLLLTGTPLQNNLQELWSLLFFLMPSGDDGHGGFAALSNFTTALARPANQILDQGRQELDAEAQATVKQLHEVLRPYLLRRLKADVEKQMPGKYEHVVYCRLSKRQRQLYDGFMSRADTRQVLAGGNYMSIMNCLMSLRKVCNHPDLFETRQIVTSFAMHKSVVAEFEIKDLLVRRRFLKEEEEKLDFDYLNLDFVRNESTSAIQSRRIQAIQAIRPFEGLIERQTRRLKPASRVDGRTVASISSHLEEESNRSILDHLQNCLRVTRQRAQRKPIYGRGLIEQLIINDSPQQIIASRGPKKKQNYGDWYMNTHSMWQDIVPTLEERSESYRSTIQKFSCVTPAVVANDLPSLALGEERVAMIRSTQPVSKPDPFHESRVRLSIAFPDKRLLQYDCGKLQRLAKLLRDLQAGGHRALIFTQMTKVLDILEQFLNIHGHRYLRLDGATKIEQRQILTDRFNNDPRILCFILSSRSGGLGINLTGADTVIFYDLDWNPAMDKQCQDRCHRIGQTRDVHIYRFVSEYTIEANILRKSNQKRLLDDVIIQKGDFTTDYFNRLTYKDAFDEIPEADDEEANAAMDRVLGNIGAPDSSGIAPVLEGIEDKEDTDAAKAAQKEIVHEVHIDDADFDENASRPSATPKTSVPPTPAPGDEGDPDELPHVDEYMIRLWEWEMRDVPLGPPPDKRRRKSRKGQEHRVRRRR